MKLAITQIFTLLTISCLGQSGQISGQISKSDSQTDFKYLTIVLRSGDIETPVAVPDTTGQFEINKIVDGVYDVVIRQIGSRDAIIFGVKVKSDSTTHINLTYPPPCNFTRDKHPKCINGHTDNIVPIVYGLPTQKTLSRASRGEVYLGGCRVSDCDPHYYCLTHKKEL